MDRKGTETAGRPRTSKSGLQMIWGIALVLMGFGVFYQIPQKMPKIAQIEQFSGTLSQGIIRICLYIVGIILISGGARKIIQFYRKSERSDTGHDGMDPGDQ